MIKSAIKAVSTRKCRYIREARIANGHHQMGGGQDRDFTILTNGDPPVLRLFVEGRSCAFGRSPDFEFHDPGICLKPIAHFILGRVDGPIFWKRQIGQMIIPNRVMERKRVIPRTPLITYPGILVDYEARNIERLQTRAKCKAALPTADNDDIGLRIPS